MKIRLRLTLIFGAVLAVMLAGAASILLVTLSRQLRSTVDAGLLSRGETIKSGIQSGGSGIFQTSTLVDPEESFAQVVASDGSVLESSPGVGHTPLADGVPLGEKEDVRFVTRDVRIGSESVSARLMVVRLEDGRTLIVGSSLDDQREAVAGLKRLLLAAGPLVLILGSLIVWAMTGAALKPVERLRQEAEAVASLEAGRTLTLPETNDEIARLGASFNRLLGKLGEALQRERKFVDEASHELRTPVSKLKSELELALSSGLSQTELKAAVERALRDVDDLVQLSEDLLVLARADQGRLPLRREQVDLASLVDQVVAGLEPRTRRDDIQIEVDVTGMGWVDPLRVRQALINLIDNSVRHSPSGSAIRVSSNHVNGDLELEVKDEGPGFSDAVLASPFGDPVSANGPSRDGGTHLGLAIVKAIVDAHEGAASLENPREGGALVRLRFPAQLKIS